MRPGLVHQQVVPTDNAAYDLDRQEDLGDSLGVSQGLSREEQAQQEGTEEDDEYIERSSARPDRKSVV